MSVNTKEVCGLTPLNLAVINQQHDCCKYLIKAAATLLNTTISPYSLAVQAGGDTMKQFMDEIMMMQRSEDENLYKSAGMQVSTIEENVSVTFDTVNQPKFGVPI